MLSIYKIFAEYIVSDLKYFSYVIFGSVFDLFTFTFHFSLQLKLWVFIKCLSKQSLMKINKSLIKIIVLHEILEHNFFLNVSGTQYVSGYTFLSSN